jgi:catechol 2,3-dioxygenase-like lactoylglutathione lyase family enzyme
MYTRLQPVLFVRDVEAEKRFYLKLGFGASYESPGFAAISYGSCVFFALQARNSADPSAFAGQAVWQIGAARVGPIYEACLREKVEIIEQPRMRGWGEWVLRVRSPNGYEVLFEGPK